MKLSKSSFSNYNKTLADWNFLVAINYKPAVVSSIPKTTDVLCKINSATYLTGITVI